MEKTFQENGGWYGEGDQEDLDRLDALYGEDVFGRKKKLFILLAIIFASLVFGLIVYLILNYFKIFLLKLFLDELKTNLFIIFLSCMLGSLLGLILSQSYKTVSNIFKILVILSSIILAGIFIFWLFSTGPLKIFGQDMGFLFTKITDSISTGLCYLSPERVASGNFDDCVKYEKSGDYKGVSINFDDAFNSNPEAGKQYTLYFVLKNENVPDDEKTFGKNIYDILVKKIEGLASSSFNFENADTVYTSTDKEYELLAGGLPENLMLSFEKLPSSCEGIMYFKVFVTTEQISKGKSTFLTLLNEKLDDTKKGKIIEEIRSFSPKTVISPGPIDNSVILTPSVIKDDDLNYVYAIINIKNRGGGISKIKEINVSFQRNYINVLDCEDPYGKNLIYSRCDDSQNQGPCLNFKEEIVLNKNNAYRINCKISFNKEKYDFSSRESFVVSEVLYEYNYEETWSKDAFNCLSRQQENPETNPEEYKCQSPNSCYKYSCPEGYTETIGVCDIIDSVCCSPNSVTPDDCPDLTPGIKISCPSPEEAFRKIACEAKKAGVPPHIMIGIAMVESGGFHCDENGQVKRGDNGKSIGIMQTSYCSNSVNVFDIDENIRCAIEIIKEKCSYSIKEKINEAGKCYPTGYCTDSGVKCEYCYNIQGIEPKTYEGWDIAIRGYNGWGGCSVLDNYEYVEKVRKYANDIGKNYI